MVDTGPDHVDPIRALVIYWVGHGEPLKVFEQESNVVQDPSEKITLAAAWGIGGKGEPGGGGDQARDIQSRGAVTKA